MPVTGEIVPFVEVDLSVGVAQFVQFFPCQSGRLLDPAEGIGKVAVIGVEIQRNPGCGALFKELFTAVLAPAAVGGTAELQMGKAFFELFCDLCEKLKELLFGAQPHEIFCVGIQAGVAAAFGFVPDLPVLNVVVESIPETFRIVTDDV